ncbi:MAG: hypothetical protein ACOX8W_08970 [bacterium]
MTDRPPAGTAGARLLFTKGASSSENPGNDFIDLDMMTLAPIAGGNLLRNPGFEEGLQGWNAVETEVSFRNSFEGAATAGMSDPFNMLWQDVPLAGIPAGSAFLFGFAAQSSFPGNFQVQVQWRGAAGNSIGQPGFVMVIGGALVEHVDYYSYLALTGPSPVGAATARVLFTASGAPNLNIFIDAVLFARAGSPNLVQNPGFENGLTNWQGGNVSAGPSDAAYEGERRARIEADGGFLAQNIPLEGAAGRCFLLNFAAGFTDAESPLPGTLLAEVIWFDRSGQEVGNGLSLVVQNVEVTETRWYNYTGVTEPAPPGTTVARISFTKGGSDEATGIIDFDLVEFGRLV